MRNLELTKEQYKKLLTMVFLGHSMITKNSKSPDEWEEWNNILSYIYSFQKDFNLKEWIYYDPKHNKYYPTETMLETVQNIEKNYNEIIMFELLADKLAKQDMMRKYSTTQLAERDEMKTLIEHSKIIEKYNDEFFHNGIENVKVG